MKIDKALRFGFAAACAVCALNVAAQTEKGGAASQETVSEKISDGVITTKVKGALLNAKDVKDSQNIHVKTTAGVVLLTGMVPNKRAKEAAAEAAKTVDGVAHVRNDLKVAD